MHLVQITPNCVEVVIEKNTILFSFGKPVAAMVERHTVARVHKKFDNNYHTMKHIETFAKRWGFNMNDFVDMAESELEQLAMGK
jgi:hypothetical protein